MSTSGPRTWRAPSIVGPASGKWRPIPSFLATARLPFTETLEWSVTLASTDDARDRSCSSNRSFSRIWTTSTPPATARDARSGSGKAARRLSVTSINLGTRLAAFTLPSLARRDSGTQRTGRYVWIFGAENGADDGDADRTGRDDVGRVVRRDAADADDRDAGETGTATDRFQPDGRARVVLRGGAEDRADAEVVGAVQTRLSRLLV